MFGKTTLIASALAISDVSGRYFWGACPKFEETNAITDLNMDLFSGKWYSIEMDSGFTWGGNSDCSFAEYSADTEGSHDLWYGSWTWMSGYSGVSGKVYAPSGEASYQTMP